jgi:hypothetical protein
VNPDEDPEMTEKNELPAGYVRLPSHKSPRTMCRKRAREKPENLSMAERIKRLNKSFGNVSKLRSSDGNGEESKGN